MIQRIKHLQRARVIIIQEIPEIMAIQEIHLVIPEMEEALRIQVTRAQVQLAQGLRAHRVLLVQQVYYIRVPP